MLKTILLGLLIAFGAFILQTYFFGRSKVTSPDDLKKPYDYIVIGAGSAGSVVAARLSEDPSKTVLVLEAGGEEPFYSHIPSMAPFLAGTPFDWGYKTEPQTEACHAMTDRRSYWPRGKGLGGTSVLNWMCYVRGHPTDFDHWARLVGDKGWSYAEVLPYFNKAETTEIEQFKTSEFHGHAGPLHINNDKNCKSCEYMLRAAEELGLDEVTDSDGREPGGFAWIQYFAHKGVRESVVRKYLRPAMERPNLHVVTNAHVRRILFASSNGKIYADGVEFQNAETTYRIQAKKEVILSAGAVNSPQILMLSGVGPADHLKDHKIPVLVDLPAVGRHLEDHLAINLQFSINATDATDFDNMFDFRKMIRTIPEYLLFGTGVWSTPPLGLVGTFNSGLPKDHPGPDLQLYISPGDSAPHRENFFNYNPDILQHFPTVPHNRSGIGILVCALHTKSRGEIRLKNNNPLHPPSINPRYMMDNDLDEKLLAKGLRIFLDMMKTKSMSKYDPILLEKPMLGCERHEFLSDKYLICIAKRRSFTLYHPVGTCRMGNRAIDSVVDAKLNVHGIHGLRIVDASIFPEITSGNTNAPTIMVAEKAADFIKSDNLA